MVLSAPDERWLRRLLRQMDETMFRPEGGRIFRSSGARSDGTSATLASSRVTTPHDSPVGRRPGAARSRGRQRLARHRRRPHRRHPHDAASRQFDGLHFDLSGHYIVPGFIDVHVHGVSGLDTLDEPSSIGAIAGAPAAFRRHGVLPDVAGVLARRAARHAAGGPGRADDARAGRRAGVARPPRKQFHQPGLQGRAAARVPSPPTFTPADRTPRQTECRGADRRSSTRSLPHDRTSASSRWLPSCRTRST